MSQVLRDLPELLVQQTAALSIADVFRLLVQRFPGGVVFSTSFSNEDQVITRHILQSRTEIGLFTLDTGRLFQATYDVWQSTVVHGAVIEAYQPDAHALRAYMEAHGPNAFYQSVALRKQCCHIRKVVPLQQALSGKSVWITGLRAEHSPGRSSIPLFEWDEQNGLIKYHPLLHWTTEAVEAYVRQHHLPRNALYDKGFTSIGCEPCTRAVRPGEDLRAGRWWWEDTGKKECGLHVRMSTDQHQKQ